MSLGLTGNTNVLSPCSSCSHVTYGLPFVILCLDSYKKGLGRQRDAQSSYKHLIIMMVVICCPLPNLYIIWLDLSGSKVSTNTGWDFRNEKCWYWTMCTVYLLLRASPTCEATPASFFKLATSNNHIYLVCNEVVFVSVTLVRSIIYLVIISNGLVWWEQSKITWVLMIFWSCYCIVLSHCYSC